MISENDSLYCPRCGKEMKPTRSHGRVFFPVCDGPEGCVVWKGPGVTAYINELDRAAKSDSKENERIYKEIQADVRCNCPTEQFDFEGTVKAKVRFKKLENEKYYITLEYQGYPREHDRHAKIKKWISAICNKYGWKPYLTSGGGKKYTFRLNGDLELETRSYANLRI